MQGELQLAWVRGAARARRVGTASNCVATTRVHVAARITQVDVVEHVEGIHPELRGVLLCDGDVLHQRHVAVEETWSPGSVAPNVSYGVKTGATELLTDLANVRQRVEIRDSLAWNTLYMGLQATGDAIRLARRTARIGRTALAVAQRERQAALPNHDRADLPSAHYSLLE